jgi:hypothetical protein
MKATESYNYQNPFDCFFQKLKQNFQEQVFQGKVKSHRKLRTLKTINAIIQTQNDLKLQLKNKIKPTTNRN